VGFNPVAADASGIDPPLGGISVQDRPGTSENKRGTLQFFLEFSFKSEDNIEVEELSESLAAPNSPLPLVIQTYYNTLGLRRIDRQVQVTLRTYHR
jgi:hypothetical protein